MNKPIIALTPLIDKKLDSFWMLPGYMEGIFEAGGILIMLPPLENKEDIEEVVKKYDGFVMTGGLDVEP